MIKQWTWGRWIVQLCLQKEVSFTVDLHLEKLWRHLKLAFGPVAFIVIDTRPL